MASISISEKEFGALFMAAHRAKDALDNEDAAILDKLARKANAALSQSSMKNAPFPHLHPNKLTWQDVPSVFDMPKVKHADKSTT